MDKTKKHQEIIKYELPIPEGVEVTVEGNSIKEVIDNLETNYEGFKARLCDEKGQIRRFINFYLNDEDIRFKDNQETQVNDGDQISIVPAIAGGKAL